MFNDYMWQTYLNAGGKDVVEAFRQLCEEEYSSESGDNYRSLIKSLHTSFCASKAGIEYAASVLKDLFDHINDGGIANECVAVTELPEEKLTLKQITRALYYGIKKEYQCDEQTVFACFSDTLEYYTTFLFIWAPDLFVPYYFRWNFNVLERIASEFDITLPPMPIKKDYKGRFFYYRDICESLLDFRDVHNLSPYELCAFLYDFAPKYIGGIDSYIIKDLPEPKSAFFIGGSKDDIFLDENTDKVTCWQCNPDTRAGDMIVMYLRSPISAVDSVWRSVSIGFNDPFFYYYRCTYIANPVGIKRISQKQLQQDPIFKDMPIVRKNMQGINGVELKPSEYNHLMDISKADVPRLEFIVSEGNQDFVNEKDVENKLIKPLITKLGYSQEEYVQQLQIEVGNHNYKLIPDFVLLPVTARGHQSGFAVIEAKHTIHNQKEMEEVRIQARSYACQLRVKYSVIASKDRIWVYVPDDDFTKEAFSASWGELNDADTFSHLFRLIGKRIRQ